mmetsp:Transcript_3575/g.10100  ORF Transcript_3575/g.10100 Transcript_3575/m.10100 type:complete len:329 (+) Transcript_3575:887-1873(+)
MCHRGKFWDPPQLRARGGDRSARDGPSLQFSPDGELRKACRPKDDLQDHELAEPRLQRISERDRADSHEEPCISPGIEAAENRRPGAEGPRLPPRFRRARVLRVRGPRHFSHLWALRHVGEPANVQKGHCVRLPGRPGTGREALPLLQHLRPARKPEEGPDRVVCSESDGSQRPGASEKGGMRPRMPSERGGMQILQGQTQVQGGVRLRGRTEGVVPQVQRGGRRLQAQASLGLQEQLESLRPRVQASGTGEEGKDRREASEVDHEVPVRRIRTPIGRFHAAGQAGGPSTTASSSSPSPGPSREADPIEFGPDQAPTRPRSSIPGTCS